MHSDHGGTTDRRFAERENAMTRQNTARQAAAPPPSPRPKVEQEIADLRALTVRELQDKYAALFGRETPSHNRRYLFKKLAWKLQELREGGLDEATRHKAAELARDAQLRPRKDYPVPELEPQQGHPRDARLPAPGTVLRKEHAGVVHEITVLDEGFEYAGRRYKSLSRIAKEVTGTSWNGFLWMGLVTRKRKTKER